MQQTLKNDILRLIQAVRDDQELRNILKVAMCVLSLTELQDLFRRLFLEPDDQSQFVRNICLQIECNEMTIPFDMMLIMFQNIHNVTRQYTVIDDTQIANIRMQIEHTILSGNLLKYINARQEVLDIATNLMELYRNNSHLRSNIANILAFAISGSDAIGDPNARTLSPCEIRRIKSSDIITMRELNPLEIWGLDCEQVCAIMNESLFAKDSRFVIHFFRLLQLPQINYNVIKSLNQYFTDEDEIDLILSTSLSLSNLGIHPLAIRAEQWLNLDASQYEFFNPAVLFAHPYSEFPSLNLLLLSNQQIKNMLQILQQNFRLRRNDFDSVEISRSFSRPLYYLITPFFMIHLEECFAKLNIDAIIKAARSEGGGFLKAVRLDKIFHPIETSKFFEEEFNVPFPFPPSHKNPSFALSLDPPRYENPSLDP